MIRDSFDGRWCDVEETISSGSEPLQLGLVFVMAGPQGAGTFPPAHTPFSLAIEPPFERKEMQFFPLPHTTPFFFGGSPLDTNDNVPYNESRERIEPAFRRGRKQLAFTPTHALFFSGQESNPDLLGRKCQPHPPTHASFSQWRSNPDLGREDSIVSTEPPNS